VRVEDIGREFALDLAIGGTSGRGTDQIRQFNAHTEMLRARTYTPAIDIAVSLAGHGVKVLERVSKMFRYSILRMLT